MTEPLLDKRLHAFRTDLAAEKLRGRVEASRYVVGEPRQVRAAIVPVRSAPGERFELTTEALFGERLDLFEEKDGWAWVQLGRDGYVGYVPSSALTRDVIVPTHRVTALATYVYAEPDIKSPPLICLSLNSEVFAAPEGQRFMRLASGGYVVSRHLGERTRHARDWVEVAEKFVGVPYLWGGRSRLGIDCSGLVQIAIEAAGLDCPRDSDMQAAMPSQDLLIPEPLDGLERGDLVCWPGHVGIAADAYTLLHANAHHMAVVTEPMQSAAERIAKDGKPIKTIKRLGCGLAIA